MRASPVSRYESRSAATTAYSRSPSSRLALNMRSSPSTPGSVSSTEPWYSRWSETRSESKEARKRADGEVKTVVSMVWLDNGDGLAGILEPYPAPAPFLPLVAAGRFVERIEPAPTGGVSVPEADPLAPPPAADTATAAAALVKSGKCRSRAVRCLGTVNTVLRKAISASASSWGMSGGRTGNPGGRT